MITPEFKLQFTEKNHFIREYLVLSKKGVPVGLISFKVDKEGGIHIHNVFVDSREIKFTSWLKTFRKIYAYSVVPESVSYWEHLKAVIVSTVPCDAFEPIVIERSELDDNS